MIEMIVPTIRAKMLVAPVTKSEYELYCLGIVNGSCEKTDDLEQQYECEGEFLAIQLCFS